MSQSTLSRLLTLFEESSGALSVRFLAQELEVTSERLEGMVDFWIRKGKIRVSAALTDCGSCGVKGDCPLIMNMPRTFELVADADEPDPTRPLCRTN